MLLTTFLLLLLSRPYDSSATAVSPHEQVANQRSPMSPTKAEAIELTNGWALLTEGKMDQALVRADTVLAANPRSVAAFVLGVEAELARGGSTAALARYERWIGARTLEEPSVLRRIAFGLLRELASTTERAPARLEALRALVEDGDTVAATTLQQGVKASSLAEARVLASMGDETAVKLLITDLTRSAGRGMTNIEALGASGSSLAVAALSAHLTHGLPEIRAAAVEGLGKLGAKYNTASRIKPLLSDSTSYVRVKAAAALYALGDMSGLRILQDLAAQESPAGRLMAAQAMASQPGGEWQETVRQLTSAPQPEVRVGAARLLLPHQPEVARRVLEAATNDPNPAIRSMASETIVDAFPAGDLRALRQMLKTGDIHVRVRAAARILELVR